MTENAFSQTRKSLDTLIREAAEAQGRLVSSEAGACLMLVYRIDGGEALSPRNTAAVLGMTESAEVASP
jgi:hypothetical protein